jgi:hypothetical protein
LTVTPVAVEGFQKRHVKAVWMRKLGMICSPEFSMLTGKSAPAYVLKFSDHVKRTSK